MNEELREKVLEIIIDEHPWDYAADAILSLFTSSLVKAQREAFVAGAYACTDEGLPLRIKEARLESEARYPDLDEADNGDDFTEEDEESALEGYPDA